MGRDGWTVANRITSETTSYGGPSIVLEFQRGEQMADVMIVFSTEANYTMVMVMQIDP